MKTLKQLTLGSTFAIVLSASVLAQCPIGQYCPPQPQQTDPYAALREQQREQREAHERQMQDLYRQEQNDRQREQANRPMCTTYHTDPMTGVVKAVTVPCY